MKLQKKEDLLDLYCLNLKKIMKKIKEAFLTQLNYLQIQLKLRHKAS